MSGMPTVKLAKPIESLKVVQTPTIIVDVPALSPQDDIGQGTSAEAENQRRRYVEVLRTIETIAENLQLVYDKAIVEHRQGIAKLAVEIARKILVQKVKDEDYQIETIIQEALNNVPTRQDIVVRLNPRDLARYQEIQQHGDAVSAGVKFVADPGISPAQCIVDTPKGKIESLIDEHLEQVARALSKAV